MEVPSFILVLYLMYTLPTSLSLPEPLPRENWLMAGMFVSFYIILHTSFRCFMFPSYPLHALTPSGQTIHYIYRSLISPLLLNPSMSPIHPIVWLAALSFNVLNAVSIGGWLGGYGPTTKNEWAHRFAYVRFQLGIIVWAAGFLGNIYHDDELREIRRAAARQQKQREEAEAEGNSKPGEKRKNKSVDKVYLLPHGGLFELVLFPHYLCEWIEWAGFWMVGGLKCVPARSFMINEIATMTPRAVAGRRWYIERFGREKVGRRRAVIPWLI